MTHGGLENIILLEMDSPNKPLVLRTRGLLGESISRNIIFSNPPFVIRG